MIASRDISELLGSLSSVPRERGTIPATGMVLLRFGNGKLRATCDNLEVRISRETEIGSDIKGTVLVDYFALKRFVSSVPGRPLDFSIGERELVMAAGDNTFRMACEDTRVFPERKEGEGEPFTVGAKSFIDATKNCLLFISIKDMDHFRLVQYVAGDGFYAYGGSSYRAHRQGIECKKGKSFNLSVEAAKQVSASLLPEGEVKLVLGGSNITFEQDCVLIDATLPAQNAVKLESLFVVNRADFALNMDFALFKNQIKSVSTFTMPGSDTCSIGCSNGTIKMDIDNLMGHKGNFKQPCKADRDFGNNVVPTHLLSAANCYNDPLISITDRGFYLIEGEGKSSLITINQQ